MISQIEHAAEFVRDDTTEQKLAKLDALLARAGAAPEAVDLIADLPSLPARRPVPELSPQGEDARGAARPARRTGAGAAGANLVRGLALDRPDLA